MKAIIKYPLLFILLVFFFAACKKKQVPLTTAKKIQGTWQLQSEIYHQNVGGVDYSDTTLGNGATIEFRSDNKAYSDFQGQKDTAVYTLTGDTQITLNGTDIYDIKTLTSNQFVLYSKQTQGADYYEGTITLVK
ncbi:MAG: lipocalin family protein [Bacteroidota bacterium]|nr:lipocalin family protein [Bacteroidota bacterium]